MTPQELESFKDWGAPLPSREAHGTPEDIRGSLQSVNPRNWHLKGNRLIAQTDMGELVQTIPTNYILTGTNEAGLPIFKKL